MSLSLLVGLGNFAVDAVAPAVGCRLLDELELVAVEAPAQPRDRDALRDTTGEVDVQQRPLGQRDALQILDEPRRERRGGKEVELGRLAEVELERGRLLRDRDARKPQHDRLERRRDGAGVGDVIADVGAVVDAGDDHLRPPVLHQTEVREPHAVDRGAVGRVADAAIAEVDLLDPERAARGDRAGHRGAVAVWGDDAKVDPGCGRERAAQGEQALRFDSVVIGQQNTHESDARRHARKEPGGSRVP